MTVVLSSAVVVFGVLVFLLLGALVELYRSVEQLREHSGLLDRPRPVDLVSSGIRPSTVGLPAHLDGVPGAVVLFLSDKCATCRSIAAALDGAVPRDVVLVLDAGGAAEAAGGAELTLRYDLGERVVVDHDRVIADRLGIRITPVAVVVEQGRLVRASTVPSTRQMYALLDSVRAPALGEVPDDIGDREARQPSLAGKEQP